MRLVIGVVLALSVGIGAYFGSAQVAGSAKTPPRRVTLQIGDVAAVGQVQCRAGTSQVRHPLHADYLQCSKGPLSRAAGSVAVSSVGVDVQKKVRHVQCFLETPGYANRIFSASLVCTKGPRYAGLSIEVQPGGINVVLKHRKIVYRTGWKPG